MEKRFNGKVALVTGAASGIGRATAIAFAKEGAKVVVADILEDQGKDTIQQIYDEGGEAIFIHCDVGSTSDIKGMVKATIDSFGRLDQAFNNAGIEGDQEPTVDCSEENWDKVLNVNLKSVWTCMKYEIPEMIKLGGGAIVNCSSIAGLVGFPGVPAYTASKHGVVGLTKTAALENAKENIRINAVCPGIIDTPMIERYTHGDKGIEAQLVAGEPVGRIGTAEEIAAAVVWLCSEDSSFVTGHAMPVDGGWTTQ